MSKEIKKIKDKLIYRSGVFNNRNEQILMKRINELHDVVNLLIDEVNELNKKLNK